ncbi:glycine-rich protein, partial [Brevibacillus laterosporus]|uniref:glycine-rich protein n=1 Tax=Brevibacillus laterosporus TaxID=1465 RepID=UPI003D19B2A9
MSTGIVIFCDGEAVRSDTGGIKQYANGFTVNKDIILHTVEAKISNPFSSSENATITLWDDTGNLIAQKTKLISENLSPAWVSFEFTPVKLIAGREYVVGMTSLGVRLWLDNENLPKIIKSNTVGFDFTIKNHRNRFSDTYTSAPPVDKYQHINDFKLIGDFNSAPTMTLTSNNQPLIENQRINIGTNDFTVNINANDADPDDTLQYQVKLNNVVKQAWTAIGKNQPVGYTFKNADVTAGATPFTVSVRDDKGNQTDFNAELTKGKIGKDTQGRTTYTFEYTGKPEVFMVPANVTKLKLEAWGAEGGKGKSGNQTQAQGGQGGNVQGEWKSLNRDILTIYVGGKGKDSIGSSGGGGGFNGGGNGGDGFDSTYAGGGGGGGGGASDIRIGGTSLVNRLIVAAGGGGSGSSSSVKSVGGYGGGLTGGNGFGGGPQAGGGTQSAGGIGGEYASFEGENGGLGVGGGGVKVSGSIGNPAHGGGGGGAGYYGGGGGGYSCSGGGGSSYYGNLANGSTTAGVREGNGLVVITILNEPPKCTLTSPPDNQTLTENTTLNIQGTASDTDKDNVVTIKYRVNNG